MDEYEDQDLFFIAKEGLKAPLPAPWKVKIKNLNKFSKKNIAMPNT